VCNTEKEKNPNSARLVFRLDFLEKLFFELGKKAEKVKDVPCHSRWRRRSLQSL
jgi:hypothetical protein